MSAYRFYNARLLTMEEPLAITAGELWTRDGDIVYIGEGDEKKASGINFDEEINVNGNLLMPGFKNAHTHSAMVFLRSMADDLPLQEWLNDQVFPREARLTPDDIYELSKLAILEYLSGGVTSVFEMYLTPESIAVAFSEFGMRCVQVGCVNNFSQSIGLLDDMYTKLNKDSDKTLQSFMIGFHAEYTCSRELLSEVAELAKKHRAPVWAHNSETKSEVAGCLERYSVTPTALMDSLGIFDYGGGGYHCVYLDDGDIEIFKRRGLSVVTNPASNAKLASGIAPVAGFLKEGINVAIGTDGPASNNCLDMFREMFLVTALAKLKAMDAAGMDGADVLRMATVRGAKAMGLTGCDVLAAGKKADLIMLDMHQPNMQPENNIVKNIVYSGSKENVKLTMINGVIRYRDGSFFVGEDPERIYKKAGEIKNRVL